MTKTMTLRRAPPHARNASQLMLVGEGNVKGSVDIVSLYSFIRVALQAKANTVPPSMKQTIYIHIYIYIYIFE